MCRLTMFNILGRLSKVISLHSKKNQSHTANLSEDIDTSHRNKTRFRMTSLCTTVVQWKKFAQTLSLQHRGNFSFKLSL